MRKYQIVAIILLLFAGNIAELHAQSAPEPLVVPGAARKWTYLSYVGDKPFAVVANHTSLIGDTHLVDTLVSMKYNLKKIFSPEHGFRGDAEAGAYLYNSTDTVTGLPVISLYGDNKKPKPKDLEDIEIVLFDIQDVGARFYTYISTLTLVMEACAENDIPLVVLDRPNPNGFYVDGPVLEPGFESFVGMHPVPVVHGMTMAEYAHMVNQEGWINGTCDLSWVKCKNYTHKTRYQVPVSPSPNLKSMEAIYLYPSLCLFEGTTVSIGRGTNTPFEIYGHPRLSYGDYRFTPRPNAGSSSPKHNGEECRGQNLRFYGENFHQMQNKFNLYWVLEAYKDLKDENKFFNPFFDKLAGTDQLRKQILAGKDIDEIKRSWQHDLKEFKKMRKKYLLYPDFE